MSAIANTDAAFAAAAAHLDAYSAMLATAREQATRQYGSGNDTSIVSFSEGWIAVTPAGPTLHLTAGDSTYSHRGLTLDSLRSLAAACIAAAEAMERQS